MKRSGQITVLVLLLGLLGLTTALSVASRSLSDLKQVTQVDVGTKTFAAAEAGLEFALNDFTTNFDITSCTIPAAVTFPMPNGIQSITYTICANNRDYAIQNVSKDDVFELDLPANNPNNLKFADVMWQDPTASVEIDVIDNNSVATRYFYNPASSSKVNGFSSGVNIATCNVNNCNDSTFSSWAGCVSGIPNIDSARIVRLKPLYSNSNIAFCGQPQGSSPGRIPFQNYVITVTATSTNGTVKKIQATKTEPTLPAIFDNVLFSGGDITK